MRFAKIEKQQLSILLRILLDTSSKTLPNSTGRSFSVCPFIFVPSFVSIVLFDVLPSSPLNQYFEESSFPYFCFILFFFVFISIVSVSVEPLNTIVRRHFGTVRDRERDRVQHIHPTKKSKRKTV